MNCAACNHALGLNCHGTGDPVTLFLGDKHLRLAEQSRILSLTGLHEGRVFKGKFEAYLCSGCAGAVATQGLLEGCALEAPPAGIMESRLVRLRLLALLDVIKMQVECRTRVPPPPRVGAVCAGCGTDLRLSQRAPLKDVLLPLARSRDVLRWGHPDLCVLDRPILELQGRMWVGLCEECGDAHISLLLELDLTGTSGDSQAALLLRATRQALKWHLLYLRRRVPFSGPPGEAVAPLGCSGSEARTGPSSGDTATLEGNRSSRRPLSATRLKREGCSESRSDGHQEKRKRGVG